MAYAKVGGSQIISADRKFADLKVVTNEKGHRTGFGSSYGSGSGSSSISRP